MGTIVKAAPATLVAGVVALVQAVIGLVVAFGVVVNGNEQTAIAGVVVAFAAVIPLAGAAIDHARATSKSNVTSAAIRSGPALTAGSVSAIAGEPAPTIPVVGLSAAATGLPIGSTVKLPDGGSQTVTRP